MELEHHGQDILTKVDSDINAGKIELFTDQKLKDLAVYKMFEIMCGKTEYYIMRVI